MNNIQVITNINELNKAEINIIIDLNTITKIDDFIKQIYKWLWCPDDFWLNLNAFFDTIWDQQFWVQKPLNIVIKNFKSLYYKNPNLRMLLSDVLIDIIQIEWQKYNICLLKNK